MNREAIIDQYQDFEFVFLDPPILDKAIIGVVCFPESKVVYSYELLIQALMEDDPELDEIDAIEWYNFNIESTGMGDHTPMYARTELF